jgi:hypothetical protein
MEYTTLALVLVLLVAAVLAWMVIAAARKDGGPPDGRPRERRHTRVRRPSGDEPEVESEGLANRPR